ncbi:MAG: hypothetical protein DHS20C14_19100 [Phycisphaeraceae bacterium]|nr:MAG: hypothetical protein DHS20C14_19100 [Phycisphaeraceae bacterium]
MGSQRARGTRRVCFIAAAALATLACALDVRSLNDAPRGLTPLGARLSPAEDRARPWGDGYVRIGWLANTDDPASLILADTLRPRATPPLAEVSVRTTTRPIGLLRVQRGVIRHRLYIADDNRTADAHALEQLESRAREVGDPYAADLLALARATQGDDIARFDTPRARDALSVFIWLTLIAALPGHWYALAFAARTFARVRELWREAAEEADRRLHRALRRPFEPDAKRGLCAACGYDLAGLPGLACPECGSPILPHLARS